MCLTFCFLLPITKLDQHWVGQRLTRLPRLPTSNSKPPILCLCSPDTEHQPVLCALSWQRAGIPVSSSAVGADGGDWCGWSGLEPGGRAAGCGPLHQQRRLPGVHRHVAWSVPNVFCLRCLVCSLCPCWTWRRQWRPHLTFDGVLL